MDLNINEYISFDRLFSDLFEIQSEQLEIGRFEAEHFQRILDFKDNDYKDFEIINDECDFDSSHIVFVFGYDFNDSNESCTQSTTAIYVIIYDTVLDEFTSCEFEQG